MSTYALFGARIPSQTMPPAPVACTITPDDAPPASRRQFRFKPLSSTQRQCIGRKASAAYAELVAAGKLPPPAPGKKTAAAEEWRHGEYLAVTGHDDLAQCTQDHFRALRSHFDAIIGTPAASARSFRDTMRTGKATAHSAPEDTHEARELWRHNLNEALAKYGYTIGYAAVICRGKYRKELGQATADQLRNLVFAVHGNGRKRKANHPEAPDTATPAPRPRLNIIKPPRPADDDIDRRSDTPSQGHHVTPSCQLPPKSPSASATPQMARNAPTTA